MPKRICLDCKRLIPANQRRCDEHEQTFNVRRKTAKAPLDAIYTSYRWRKFTRPAVLERDGYACRYCGTSQAQGATLDVAHLEPTWKLLREGADVYDPAICVTACRSCHNANAPHRKGGGGS